MKFEDSWDNNTHQDVEDAIKDKVEEIEGRIDDVENSVPDAETIEGIRQAAQDAQDAAAALGNIINENSGRVSHDKAPAVVLRYIHQNGTDDMSLDDLNAGDVYADVGGSLELVIIENGSKTVKNIGIIDKGLIFYSIREQGFYRYLGSATWELLSQGGGEEPEGTYAELDVDSRLKHIQSPVMALDCISQSEEPGIADCPIGGYYCYMGNQASACRIRYRKPLETAGSYRDIDLSSPQGHVLYYNKPEDKTYRWDGQKFVAVLWHAGLANDNRLMSSRATAVVLWYISANLDDGETPMGANSGDVYCDSNNHIIVRGGTINPNKEYATAANLPTTPDADLGLPDQKLVYYDVNKKGFYRWNGVEWKKALDIDIDTTNLVTITQLNNTLSSYATKSDLSGKQDTLQFDNAPTANSPKMVKSGGIYTALQNLLSNISIGANGNWYIGDTTDPSNDTGVKAQGPTGNVSISDANDILTYIVNDLATGGGNNILSAEMGKVLRKNGAIIAAKVDSLINALAGIAYIGNPVAPIGQLDWEGAAQTTYSVTTNFTGCDATETLPATVNEFDTLSFTLSAEQGYILPYGIKVTVGGSPVAASYNRVTGAVSIEAILGDVVIEAAALDEDNIAFTGVGIYPNTSDTAFLMVGLPETRYISPIFDLGANRSSAVSVKYRYGGVAMFDANGVYNGALSAQSSETTGEIPATSRYIRLFGNTADMSSGILKVSDLTVFDGDAVGSDIGDADAFFTNSWCPQPNGNGDYVGWVFRFPGDAGNTPKITSNSADERKDLNACMCTQIGGGVAGAQGDYVIGKLIDMPMVEGLENKIKYSVNEAIPVASPSSAPLAFLRLYTVDNGVVTSTNYSTFDTTVTWTQNGGVGSPHYVRAASFGDTGSTLRNKTRMFCKKSSYYSESMHVFIANGNNKVLWINPAYNGDVHDFIGTEVNS